MTYSTDTDKKKQREYLFALASVEGVGPVRIKRLLTRFGNVERIFDAELVEIAQLPQFNPTLALRILTVRKRLTELRQKLGELANQNITVLFPEDNEYPTLLKSIPDAPTVLCRVGELSEVSEKCVAIVGTKRPSAEGINVTLELSIRLVEAGFTVVSGLANAIDTTAHNGALAVNGTTIAVLSTDLSSVYPVENIALAKKICETGCLFSEHPFKVSPTPANLVLRNRIISGISMASVVVETSREGGAMHTARYAQRQDRPVLACQWDADHQQSDGTRQLINKEALSFLPNQLETVVDMLTNPERLEDSSVGTSVEQMTLFDNQ